MTNIKIRKHFFTNQEVHVHSFEQKFDITLPAIYRRFLLMYDGGKLDETQFQLENFTFFIESFYGFEGDTKFFALLNYQEHLQTFLEKSFLPIANDAFGNEILLCVRGVQYGSIYFYAQDKANPYQHVCRDFSDFLDLCHSDVDMFQYEVYADVILYSTYEDDQIIHENMHPNARDKFITIESSVDKIEQIQQLLNTPDVYKDGFLQFDHLAFKLIIIQSLMYEQERLAPFDIYEELERYQIDTLEVGQLFQGPLWHSLNYFKQLKIPCDLAQYITELKISLDISVYQQINPKQDAISAPYIVCAISERELSQFKNLETVKNHIEDNADFVSFLRINNIDVLNYYDTQDYTSKHIFDLLQNPEKCLQTSIIDAETFLQLLYETYGGYYSEIFSPYVRDVIVKFGSTHQPEEFQTMIQLLADTLRKQNIILIECCISDQSMYQFIITRDMPQLQKELRMHDTDGYRIQYKLHSKRWSIYPALPSKRRSMKQKPKRRMVLPRRIKLTLIGIAFAIFILFSLEVSYTKNHFCIIYEDFVQEFRIVSNGLDDTYLEDIEGNRLLEEMYLSIEPTYSSLVALHSKNYDTIYDIDTHTRLDEFFIYVTPINLVKDGVTLDYSGILGTKDDRHWILYTKDHKDGMKVNMHNIYYVYDDDAIDLDTASLIREEE